jgi:formate hydrogenlyase subunit 3/multisubunit Na+/H+ antiporter MnhD subunit
MDLHVILWCAAALLGTSLIGMTAGRRLFATRLLYGLALLICARASSAGLMFLLAGDATPVEVRLPLGLPWLGAHFRLDLLSSFFLLVVNLGAATASLYAIGYGAHEREAQRVLAGYPLFLSGMNLVVLAADAFTFLLSWEFMSLSSWALVIAHHRDPENVRAGYIYLLMASFGTLCLLLGFGLLAGAAGSYGFDMMRTAPPTGLRGALVFALVLIGAGSKAGLVPLHVWLPLAHPAAPSHVSALMSGVMTKVAVYGFVRIVFDLLGPPEWWWGAVVLAVAAVTAFLGVLYALMQHDLKRLLAYHTVENIGIIYIGLGLALAFRASAMPTAAALAMTAALFHVLNHSLFKSLLFFGSGAVLVATGERDMDRLGGLIRRMPATAFFFLIGSVAISALPPFNGFASEWLTFQAILLSPDLPQWALKFLVPAVGTMLACSAALAAACFVKAFGSTFLGRARAGPVAQAGEADGWSLGAMGLLAVLCLVAGILPGAVMDTLGPVVEPLCGGRLPLQAANRWLQIIPVAASRSSYNGLLLFIMIAVAATLTAAAIHSLGSRALRRGPAWDCGFPDPSPMTQYTSASFAQPIRRVFGTLVFRAREEVTMPPPGDMSPARLRVWVHDPVWNVFYAPLRGMVMFAADRLNQLQFLTIRRYLMLVFGALVLLLVALAVRQS